MNIFLIYDEINGEIIINDTDINYFFKEGESLLQMFVDDMQMASMQHYVYVNRLKTLQFELGRNPTAQEIIEFPTDKEYRHAPVESNIEPAQSDLSHYDETRLHIATQIYLDRIKKSDGSTLEFHSEWIEKNMREALAQADLFIRIARER